MTWLEQNKEAIVILIFGMGPFFAMIAWVLWMYFKDLFFPKEDALERSVRLLCQGMEKAMREEKWGRIDNVQDYR